MNRRFIQFAIAGALATGLALAQTPQTPANPAQPAPAQAKPYRARVHQRLMQALNLTDAQRQQAKAIFQAAKAANQPIRAQLQQNRQALAAAVKANDVNQIQHLTQMQGTLMGKMMASRSEAMAKFYTTLTPTQKAKADQIQQKVRQHMAQRGANG